MRKLAFALALAAQASGPSAFDVSRISVSDAAVICELDLGVLRGEMRRLSWSPDNQYIHLQTIEDDRSLRDYLVDLHTREVSLAYGERGALVVALPEPAAIEQALDSRLHGGQHLLESKAARRRVG